VLAREPPAGASEAGDHLVGDQQHVELVAERAHRAQPPDRRHDEAARREHRLHDHGGDGVRPLALDGRAQLADAARDEVRLATTLQVPEGMGRRDLHEARHLERLVGLGQVRQSAHREGAHGGAVVAALQGDHLVLARLARCEPVLPRDLHRALVGLRAAHREHRVAEVAGGDRGDLLGQLRGGSVGELAGRRVVGQAHRLLRDRLRDLAPAVPHVDHRQAREAVEQLLALLGPDPHALPAIDHQLLVGEERMVLRLVGPQVPDGLRVGRHGRVSRKW
jgi:hypothetical protein